MKRLIALFMFSFLVIIPAIAGWHILKVTEDMGVMEQANIYIEGSKIKRSEGVNDFIYDQETKTITFVNNAMKVYWKGTSENFNRELAEAKEAMMEEALLKIPEAQRAKYKEMLKKQKEASQAGADTTSKIEVINTGLKETIAGYTTTKYQVKVDDKLTEEIWIADTFNPFKDMDMKMFDELMESVSGVEAYGNNEAYKEILKKGYPLRKKTFTTQISGMQFAKTEEVKTVNEKTLDNNFFLPAEGHKQMSLADILIEKTRQEPTIK